MSLSPPLHEWEESTGPELRSDDTSSAFEAYSKRATDHTVDVGLSVLNVDDTTCGAVAGIFKTRPHHDILAVPFMSEP
ncbi:MAG: hypothetical protein ABI664_07940 [bacterium]